MTGVVDDGEVRAGGGAREILQGPPHGVEAEVGLATDREAQAREGLADGSRVIGRIGETRDALVAGIADDQRHPFFSRRRPDQHQPEEQGGEKLQAAPHRIDPFAGALPTPVKYTRFGGPA